MLPDTAEPSATPDWRARWRGLSRSPLTRRILAGAGIALLLLILLVGAFPVGIAKDWTARRLSARFGTPVSIGAMSREPVFSFSPTIVIRDLRIAQPRWAGAGDMVRAPEVRLRVPLLPALIGRGLRPEAIEARDPVLALVRDASGCSNWGARKGGGGGGLTLSDLTVTRGRFTLSEARRHLMIAGTIEAGARGVAVRAQGRFRDAPVTLALDGGPVSGHARAAPWPFRLRIASPLLRFDAQGQSVGALNTGDMRAVISAQAPSLKYLDDIIQAHLFGTQAIDLRADVRRKDRDWFIDTLAGSVGRSRLTGKATILKRAGRSRIDATIAFSQLDFDDLGDDEGQAEAAALKAQIGPRVLPNTRINFARVGKTDGVIRFSAAQLLFNQPSVFRSLRGVLRLQGKLLRIDEIDAGLANGRMTGRLLIDQQGGAPSPRLDMDLQFRDGQLGTLLGRPESVSAPFGARIALSGRGDTIREALTRASGHVGFVAGNGEVSRAIAAVLAQDMGKAIGAALGDGSETVPLRCIAVGFEARDGTLAARPFLIETATSRSRGEGMIELDGERIALSIGGAARQPSPFPLVDPIHIGGTLSAPDLELAPGGKGMGGMLGALVKSVGGALGLVDRKGPEIVARGPMDCAGIAKNLLTVGLPESR